MKFVTPLSRSRLNKNSPAVVNFFREPLPVKLQVKIMNLENPPKDIDGWYKWAKQIDNTAKRTRAIIAKSLQNLKTNKLVPWYYFPWWECDPNAINVDALSMEERERLMKEGKCFQCKKSGHLAKDCPNKDDQHDRKKEELKKKWEGKSYIPSSETSSRIHEASWRSRFLKWRTELRSVSPILNIHSVTVAGGTSINQNYAKNFETKLLDQPIIAKNVDGTVNKKGTIKSYVDLEFKIWSKNFREQFYITGLGKQRIILGCPWLKKIIHRLIGKLEKLNGNYKSWILGNGVEGRKTLNQP